jgi:LysM domain
MGHIGPRPRWWLPFAVAGGLLVVAGVTGYGLAQIVAVVASAPAPRATLAPATLVPTPPETIGPSATATPAATEIAASPSPSPRIHVVRRGEYVSQIALLYGVTPEAILEANDIPDPNYVEIGDELVIPPP